MYVSVQLAHLGVTIATAPLPLTARQEQVARLATRGLSNLEIADELGIGVDTVKKHLKAAFVALDVTNRTELVGRIAISLAAASSKPFEGTTSWGGFRYETFRTWPR